MKYRIRSIICILLAGLIVSIISCKQQPSIKLLTVKTLSDFPSASAIEFSQGRFYLFGDDAAYLLVLDSGFNKVDTVRYSTDTSYRIPATLKPDIESATILTYNDEHFLYALGSYSIPTRKKLLQFPLSSLHDYLNVPIELGDRLLSRIQGVEEINFEGLAFVHSQMVIANRANSRHRKNQLVLAGSKFNELTYDPLPVIEILFDTTKTIGISGLCYSEEADKLFFTASEEDTPSAIQDGVIGDSYIGWINRFSLKMKEKSVSPDKIINLSSVDSVFVKKKIESICVEKTSHENYILDLVSDNDNGQSMIFRIQLAK